MLAVTLAAGRNRRRWCGAPAPRGGAGGQLAPECIVPSTLAVVESPMPRGSGVRELRPVSSTRTFISAITTLTSWPVASAPEFSANLAGLAVPATVADGRALGDRLGRGYLLYLRAVHVGYHLSDRPVRFSLLVAALPELASHNRQPLEWHDGHERHAPGR